jgi:Ecdysteroid kinase-like family
VPRSPAQISPNWLTAVLCAETPGARVRAVTPVGGHAGTTTRATLEIIYSGASFWQPPTRITRAQVEDLFTALRRAMQIASHGPRTYLHGDLHIANTYLARVGRMGICDWQLELQGSGAHDYAYLIATALEVEDRRAWEPETLHFYLEHLAGAGGEKIPFAPAWQAYRQATFYPYFAWVYRIGRSRLQPKFQPGDVSLAMIGRISAAIDDLDAFDAVGL